MTNEQRYREALEKIAGEHFILGNRQKYSEQAMVTIAKEALSSEPEKCGWPDCKLNREDHREDKAPHPWVVVVPNEPEKCPKCACVIKGTGPSEGFDGFCSCPPSPQVESGKCAFKVNKFVVCHLPESGHSEAIKNFDCPPHPFVPSVPGPTQERP